MAPEFLSFFEFYMTTFVEKFTLADKKALVLNVASAIEEQLAHVLKSATSAHGGATHEDAVAKSKYDTHGLELSYLAGSHFQRAKVLETELSKLKAMPVALAETNAPIGTGTLVALNSANTVKLIFLSPYGAGLRINYQEENISVISPLSPLGQEILDSYEGDEFTLSGQEICISKII